MQKLNDIIETYTGYYSLTDDFSGEGFEGENFELNADECKVFFGMEGSGDEHRFREKLNKMDEWFIGKPYKIKQNALNYVAKWLRK